MALTSAPAATSSRADSTSPSRAANISGVSQPLANSSDLLAGLGGHRRPSFEAAAVGGGDEIGPRIDVRAVVDEHA